MLPDTSATFVVAQKLAELANYGLGCKSAKEWERAPCGTVCECLSEAEVIIEALQEAGHVAP